MNIYTPFCSLVGRTHMPLSLPGKHWKQIKEFPKTVSIKMLEKNTFFDHLNILINNRNQTDGTHNCNQQSHHYRANLNIVGRQAAPPHDTSSVHRTRCFLRIVLGSSSSAWLLPLCDYLFLACENFILDMENICTTPRCHYLVIQTTCIYHWGSVNRTVYVALRQYRHGIVQV